MAFEVAQNHAEGRLFADSFDHRGVGF